jgi:hypothetical protein
LRRSVLLLAGAAIVGALVTYPTVHASLAHAQSGECSSFPGYEQIEVENTGMYVDSSGPANPVHMEPVGSCYKPQFRGTSVYGTTAVNLYTYYNEDDRCLYWNSVAGQVYTAENANGCAAQANEEFFGYQYTSGTGWTWYNVEAANDGDSLIFGDPCTNGGPVYEDSIPVPSNDCRYWNFPSDGG